MSLLSLCTITIDVDRPETTTTAHGGQSRTYSMVHTGISATKQPASGRIRDVAARQGIEVSDTFYTPTEVALRPGDRVKHGDAFYIVKWSEDQAGRGSVYAIHTLRFID